MEQFLELLSANFNLVNFPYTLMLIVTVLYWLSVIIGAMDISVLEFDVGLDADADLDGDMDTDISADGDADADADGDVSGGWRTFLHYFNVGEVPLTILLSILSLSMWAFGVMGNYYLNRGNSVLLALMFWVPNLIISLHIAKICTIPFKALFRSLDCDSEQHQDLIGKTCIITSRIANAKRGQAEVKAKGAPLLLSVRTDGEELKKGDEAVVLESKRDKGVYIITKLELEV